MQLYRAGRPAEAEPLWRAAVAQAEREFGPDSPRLAAGLDYLANLYRDLGRYAEAEPLYARELAIDERAFGPEHAHVGAALGNLALLYRLERRYAEAEPLFRRALAIQARALGPDHPEVATTLSNLAGLYRHQGRDADAEALYARALAIDEKALGPDHPTVARIRGNLAALHGAPGQAAEAGPPPATPTPAGFQRVTLDALTGYRLARSVPLAMAIPAAYAPLDLAASGRPGWFWADPGEYERLRAGATSTRGSFWARLTTNVGYDPGRDGFICGSDCAEADLLRQLEKEGVTGVRMERRTVGGVPALLIEATPPP